MTSEVALEIKQPTDDRRFTQSAIQIAQGATWFGLGVIVGSALEYLTQGLVAVRLGPERFGIFNLGLQVTSIITALAILSVPGTVTYFLPRLKAQGDTQQVNRVVNFSIWLTFLVSFLMAATLLLTAKPMATGLLNEPDLTPVLQLFALTVPATVLLAVLAGNLRGLKLSREASLLTSSYERAVRLVFILAFFALGLGVQAPVLAYLPSSVIVAILAFNYLRKAGIRFELSRPTGALSHQLFSYTWPLLLSGLITQAMPSILPLLLARFHDARDVGLYSIAWLIAPRLFGMITTAFGFLYVPVISGVVSDGNISEMQRLYRLVTKWQIIIIVPSYLLLVVFPIEFLSLLGTQYEGAALAMTIMGTARLISIGFGPVGATLLATGHTRKYFNLNIIGIILAVITGLVLIPPLGLLGASLSHLTITVGWNALTWFVVYRQYKLVPLDRYYIPIGLTSLVGLLILYPLLLVGTSLTTWVLVVAAPVFTLLVVVALVKLRILDKDSQTIAGKFGKMLLQKAVEMQMLLWQRIKERARKQ